jgi:hypothetical protein
MRESVSNSPVPPWGKAGRRAEIARSAWTVQRRGLLLSGKSTNEVVDYRAGISPGGEQKDLGSMK